jgi:dUTP pyrophosphatase
MISTIHVRKLVPEAMVPTYASSGSSGADLYAVEESTIPAHGHALLSTGIVIAMPAGMEAQIRPRSGIALKHGVTVLNAPGTIDSDYRGEIKVILINHGEGPFNVKPGMRIAQIVFSHVEKVHFEITNELEPTERGGGGFGHSGITAAKSKEQSAKSKDREEPKERTDAAAEG